MDTVFQRTHRVHPGFPFTSLWRGFANFFAVVNHSLEAQSAYTRLSLLSDAELARLGLKREDIPQYIAREYF